MLQASKMCETLKSKNPDYVSIFTGQYRYFVTYYTGHYLLLQMDKKVKSDVVMPLIAKAIGPEAESKTSI